MAPRPPLTLVRGGELFAPEPRGAVDLLAAAGEIVRLGPAPAEALAGLGVPLQVVDATGRLVVPGFVDPHQHIIGAGGEQGWASRQPEVTVQEILRAGITAVVGCLGTDTTTRHLTAVLAKARELRAAGVSAYMYTGGFPVPPPTITGSVTDDIVLFEEVLGVGEIAVSDFRSLEPSVPELARLASEAIVGGRVGGKPGVVHFHVGEGRERLGPLFAILDRHEVPARHLYPTHVTRSQELFDEAIALARRGAYVDITADDGEARWLRYYHEHGGPADRLTVSSDAQTLGLRAAKLHACFVAAVREHGLPLEEALRCFSTNAAAALGLGGKGALSEGKDADILVLERDTLRVVHVVAGGRWLLRDGEIIDQENGQ